MAGEWNQGSIAAVFAWCKQSNQLTSNSPSLTQPQLTLGPKVWTEVNQWPFATKFDFSYSIFGSLIRWTLIYRIDAASFWHQWNSKWARQRRLGRGPESDLAVCITVSFFAFRKLIDFSDGSTAVSVLNRSREGTCGSEIVIKEIKLDWEVPCRSDRLPHHSLNLCALNSRIGVVSFIESLNFKHSCRDSLDHSPSNMHVRVMWSAG
jgi:hypothetical protein